MTSDEKAFKLAEKICGWEGVAACECYAKSMTESTYDVLAKTENGQLVEGTIAGPSDLERFLGYIDVVVSLESKNFRNYPNFEER